MPLRALRQERAPDGELRATVATTIVAISSSDEDTTAPPSTPDPGMRLGGVKRYYELLHRSLFRSDQRYLPQSPQLLHS